MTVSRRICWLILIALALGAAACAPTLTPAPSAPPTDTPQPLAAHADPAGDALICRSGEPVQDSAVDIRSAYVYAGDSGILAGLGLPPHSGPVVAAELGEAITSTLTNDYSFAVIVIFVMPGGEQRALIGEVHNQALKFGEVDSPLNLMAGGENTVFVEPNGQRMLFLLPADAQAFRVQSAHRPTSDLPPEVRRCDNAPDSGGYGLP